MPVPSKPPSAAVAKSSDLLVAGVLLVAVISIVLWLLSHRWPATAWDLPRQPGGWKGILLIVAFSAIIHEFLHVLGWRIFAGTRWRSVSFVLTWRGLGLAALVHDPIPLTAFRLAALGPMIVLGVCPLILAYLSGSALIALWGAFFLFECTTDIALLIATFRVPSNAMVTSHPTELGCVRQPDEKPANQAPGRTTTAVTPRAT